MSQKVKWSTQNKWIVSRKKKKKDITNSGVKMTDKITGCTGMRWMEGAMISVSDLMLQCDEAWTGH